MYWVGSVSIQRTISYDWDTLIWLYSHSQKYSKDKKKLKKKNPQIVFGNYIIGGYWRHWFFVCLFSLFLIGS